VDAPHGVIVGPPEANDQAELRFRVRVATGEIEIEVCQDRSIQIRIDPARETLTTEEETAFNLVSELAAARPVRIHRLLVCARERTGQRLNESGRVASFNVAGDTVRFDVDVGARTCQVQLDTNLRPEWSSAHEQVDSQAEWLAYDLAMAHLLAHRNQLEPLGFSYAAVDGESDWPHGHE
jgi:hypothetical protein